MCPKGRVFPIISLRLHLKTVFYSSSILLCCTSTIIWNQLFSRFNALSKKNNQVCLYLLWSYPMLWFPSCSISDLIYKCLHQQVVIWSTFTSPTSFAWSSQNFAIITSRLDKLAGLWVVQWTCTDRNLCIFSLDFLRVLSFEITPWAGMYTYNCCRRMVLCRLTTDRNQIEEVLLTKAIINIDLT